MNSKFKRILSLFVSMILIVATAITTSVSAFAAGEKDVWYVGWTEGYKEYLGWQGNGAEFSIDAKNYYKDSRYSIKLSNKTDYNYCDVSKTIKVEPLTTYKFSAMVKYSGYKASPDSEGKYKGAFLREFYVNEDGDWINLNHSSATKSSEWTKLECMFTTAEGQTEAILNLFNGYLNNDCKGTAWFSDIKVEKAELTNEWNVLAIAFKNVDADINLKGKKIDLTTKKKGTINYKASYTDEEITEFKNVVNKLYSTLDTMSDGLVDVKDIDFVTVNDPITELADYDYDGDKWGTGAIHGFSLNENKIKQVSTIIDEKLKEKPYNMVVVYAPLGKVCGGWGGLNGNYRGIPFIQLSCNLAIRDYYGDFPESTIVHELIHQLEYKSRTLYGVDIPSLHARSDYGYGDSGESEYNWYRDYMRDEVKKADCVDPRTYWLPNGEYTLVDDDMTTGGIIKESSAFPISISKVKLSKIKDCSYTGKSIKPDVTLKDGNYTLKKGTDYTLSYKNNKKIGTATVTIKGKGIYKGERTTEFKIVKKLSTAAPTVELTKTSSKYKISWEKVAGASKYVVYYSKNGGEYKKLKELDDSKTSLTFKYNSDDTYKFAVRAYIPELEKYTKYAYI